MAGRLAVITGGEGDLAQAIAAALTADGYQVLSPGRDQLDVSQATSCSDFFSSLTGLDVLINNAGLTADAVMQKLATPEWDKVLNTNLKGAFLCAKAAAKMMLRSGGHIINIGSFSALSPPVGQANYAASKAGLIGLTKSLAAEFGPRDVKVNCVLPGFLETRMTENLSESAKLRALGAHSLGRFNTTEEAARFIAQLATLHHVSGQVFQLDSRIRRW